MSPRSAALLFPAVLLVAAAATAGSSSAGDECVTKPSGRAPQGEHWYYRRDPSTNRLCWFLGRETARVRRHMMHAANPSGAPAQPLVAPTMPDDSLASPAEAAPAASPVEAAPAAEPDVGQSAVVLRWPELAAPSSFATPIRPVTDLGQSSEPRLAASTAVPVLADETGLFEIDGSSRPAPQARPASVDDANPVFALIMAALAVLAIAGPLSHVGYRHHPRGTNERRGAIWAREPSGEPPSSYHNPIAEHDDPSGSSERLDWSEQFARAWQQLSEDTETRSAHTVLAQRA
jgi:hypothetical protein